MYVLNVKNYCQASKTSLKCPKPRTKCQNISVNHQKQELNVKLLTRNTIAHCLDLNK